jgi:putative heme-binding domain-containing protein
MFPSDDSDLNHELCQLLVYLKSPDVVAKSMKLLADAKTQEEQLFYAFHLRSERDGWWPALRKDYFNWLDHAEKDYTGGASFQAFLTNTRNEAMKTLDAEEKIALGLTKKAPSETSNVKSQIPSRKFVRNWKMTDLTPKLDQLKSGRSFENGKAVYTAVSCAQCHRFNGEGGASGPDLTGVGSRFQPIDLLEAIVLPSKVISDQYQATEIITKKKEKFFGTIQSENSETIALRPSPFSNATESIKKSQIEIRRPAKLSIMPEGLINVLSEDDVLDMIAYLRSAGNPKDKAFAHAAAN